MHTCCGPCFVYPHSIIKDEYKVSSYYFNPNIQPSMEYLRRLETLAGYCAGNNIELRVADYDPKLHLTEIASNINDRCRMCYSLRLNETARFAAEKGYDSFTTSLLVSPYQNHDLIKTIGNSFADTYGIGFEYRDFRPGFKMGQDLAKELDMYRQSYCGCIYSEAERYSKKLQRTVDNIRGIGHESRAIG